MYKFRYVFVSYLAQANNNISMGGGDALLLYEMMKEVTI